MKRGITKTNESMDKQSIAKTNSNVLVTGATEEEKNRSGPQKDLRSSNQKSVRPMSGFSRSITQKKPSQQTSLVVSPQSGEKPTLMQANTLKEEENSFVEGKSKLTNPHSDAGSSHAQSRHKGG